MDLTEMMDLLATDLSVTLGAEVSTAIATRGIQRAVDDMSRSLPRERIYEYTWIEAVTDDSFTTPAATDTDMIVDNMDLPNTVVDGSKATLTSTLWMDVPRPVYITLTDDNNSITSMTLVVKGADADGAYREERFYRPDFVPVTGSVPKYQTGKVYFKSIHEIEFSEITGNVTGDILDVGTTAGTGLWVQLEYPIEPNSEYTYSAALKSGTLYVRDTDYEMDYANGRIRILATPGTMAVATTYYANYDRAPCHIDISPIVPELIRVTKVLYPVDKVPEQSVAFTIWEDMLTIGSPRPGVSQEALMDKEHVAIFYEAKHTPPTLLNSGSYPDVLDQVVLIGAAGYVLLTEAAQYEHQAAVDLLEVKTTLGYLGIGGVGAGALTLVYKGIDDALDKVALYLETNEITAAADDANARAILEEITAQAANLRTAANGAIAGSDTVLGTIDITTLTANITAVGAALDKVSQYLQTHDVDVGGVDNAEAILENITDDIVNLRNAIDGARAGADAVLGKMSSVDLDAATVGATAWLLEGELLINQLTDGANVPENFADYARTKIQIAQARAQMAAGYVQEANLALSNLRSHIEEAGAWMRMGETFIAEASQRNAAAIGVANGERIKTEQAAGYISEANSRLAVLRSYIEDASSWMRMGEIFIGEAQARMGEADRYLAEAAQYQTTAEVDMVLSDRFRAEGQLRLAEFHTILASKAEYRKRVVSVPVRQPA